MGRLDYQLHRFEVDDGVAFAMPSIEDSSPRPIDYRRLTLDQIAPREGACFRASAGRRRGRAGSGIGDGLTDARRLCAGQVRSWRLSCFYTLYDMSQRASRVLAVSVPPEAADDFDGIAREEGRNRSELFREMLRIYRVYRETATFESLQRYGAARARALGVRDEADVERVIRQARGA